MARDLVCVLPDEDAVRNFQPDLEKIKGLDGMLCHITAPGRDYDCFSRSFAPKLSVPEDPVCGSGHCHIIPIMAKKLGKQDLLAYQLPGGAENSNADWKATRCPWPAMPPSIP